MLFSELDTPAVVVDLNTVTRNIHRFQEYCNTKGLQLRPHIKTHKLPEFARMQVEAGAQGINCQKLGEAEIMAEHGLDDILITYNILGQEKLQRLLALSRKVQRLAVTADSPYTLAGLAQTFAAEQTPLEVLVECDTGAARCGAPSPAAALALAQQVSSTAGLRFGGLMTYPPKHASAAVEAYMHEAQRLLAQAKIPCPRITSGGTPDMWQAHEAPSITEYRVGTYIYNDRSLVAYGTCTWADCALKILATVVSAPARGRAVVDAGSKSLSSDLLGLEGYGHVLERPDIRIASLSEEHGVLDYPTEAAPLQVGETVQIVPNHACVVSNLADEIALVREGHFLRKLPVVARGKVN